MVSFAPPTNVQLYLSLLHRSKTSSKQSSNTLYMTVFYQIFCYQISLCCIITPSLWLTILKVAQYCDKNPC